MKRLHTRKPSLPYEREKSKRSWYPRDFTSYQEHFNGTYDILLRNSLQDIFSLTQPGIAYKRIPWGLVSLDIEYDDSDFEIRTRSHVSTVTSSVLTKETSSHYGFHKPYEAVQYSFGHIPTQDGKATDLNIQSLREIRGAFSQLFDGVDSKRTSLTQTFCFYYGDIEFRYQLADIEKAKGAWRSNDRESIRALGKDPYGFGGSATLESYFKDKSENHYRGINSWIDYLHREGYNIEKRELAYEIW